MKNKLKENKYNLLFISECIVFLLMCLFFVPTSDDLFFAYDFLYDGLRGLIHQVFYYGNGRLISNLISMFFAKHIMFFYPLEALLIIVFSIIIEKLIGLKNLRIFVLSSIVLIPLWQFKELFSWMCAFVNYFIPIILFAFLLLILKKDLCTKHKSFFILLFLLGFSEQLFVEHNTIINLLFSAALLIYCLKKHSSSSKSAAVLLTANAAGAAVMFTYTLYIDYSKTYIAMNTPTYRKTILTYFESGGIKNALRFAMQETKFFAMTLSCCALLILALLVIMFHIERKADKKEIKHKSVFLLTGISYSVLFGLAAYNFIVFDNDIPADKKLFMLLIVLFLGLTAVLISALFYKTILKRMNSRQRLRILTLLFFAVLSFAPFLFAAPYAYRCAYLSIFFVLLSTVYLMKFANEQYGFTLDKVYDTVFIVGCIVIILYTGLYAKEKKIYNYKTEYYKTSYYLPASDENIIHWANEEFWDKHSDIEHKFIPLNEFEKIISEE